MKRTILFLILTLGAANPMSAQKTIVSTPNAPKAIGPYNQAVIAGNIIFLSGQLGLWLRAQRFLPLLP